MLAARALFAGRPMAARRAAFALGGLCSLFSQGACRIDSDDLRRVELRVWQPLRLAQGDGDLLADARRVQVTIRIDGVSDTMALTQDLDIVAYGALPGRLLEVELETFGDTLDRAEGRTGTHRLDDESEIVLPLVVAPPDVGHGLVELVPPARQGAALCAASDGRTFLFGGREGETPVATGFLLDPLARQVTPTPSLPTPRVGASCFLDEGGLHIVGGCDAAAEPSPWLWLPDDKSDEVGWTTDAAAPVGGCHSAQARLADGRFVLVNGAAISLYDPTTGGVTTTSLRMPRRSPVLASFTAEEGTFVVVGGGYDDDLTDRRPGAELLRVEGTALISEREFDFHLGAAVTGGDALYFLDGGALRRLGPSGTLASLPPSMSLPADGSSLAWTTNAQLSALLDDGTKLGVWSAAGLRTLDVTPPRPGAQLVSLPGGTLLLFGGGQAGIAVFVIGDEGAVSHLP